MLEEGDPNYDQRRSSGYQTLREALWDVRSTRFCNIEIAVQFYCTSFSDLPLGVSDSSTNRAYKREELSPRNQSKFYTENYLLSFLIQPHATSSRHR